MARCPRCYCNFQTVEDEQNMHACPRCGLEPDEPWPPRDCDECGAPATRRWNEGAAYARMTGRPQFTPVCAECWTRKDNYEPPDPDGDCFRGGEAAAYQAEQMEAARRLK